MLYSKLKKKEVVNVYDGSKLGNIVDLAIDEHSGKICSIVVPGPSRGISCFFRGGQDLVIPWEKIDRIGDDVILVCLDGVAAAQAHSSRQGRCNRV
ncbi:MAG: YlmC/YmxH family sporulation protein [Christensenellales bacterium]|jgi:YlmC/YmxH family sporulation protein